LSAVNSFNAVSKFLTCMSRMLFGHAGGNYFDDHFTVEPVYMGGSGQECLNCLAAHLGFLFDPDKHVPMAPAFVYLGVNHDLAGSKDGKVHLRILPGRRDDLVALCQRVLRQGVLHPGQACRIHYEYVESKANVADLPSRGMFLYLTDVLGSRFVPTECLRAETWSGPLRAFVALGGAPPVRRRTRKRAGMPGHLRGRRVRAAPP